MAAVSRKFQFLGSKNQMKIGKFTSGLKDSTSCHSQISVQQPEPARAIGLVIKKKHDFEKRFKIHKNIYT